MSKIAKFYENLQKSFRPKNTKKAAKKATSVFLASLLTITYISSSRFNENTQIEAAAKWLDGIEAETPSNLIATFEGEYNPKNPQKYIQLNNSNYSVAYNPNSPDKSLTDKNGNITLPPGSYKCKNFKINQTARFRIQDPTNETTKQEVTLWVEGNNTFEGINGSSRASEEETKDTDGNKYGGGAAGGTAGIYLPNNTTLYIRGSGAIDAKGGNGAKGINAENGCFIDLYKKYENNSLSGSDYELSDNYRLTNISTLLRNDMSKEINGANVGTIENLNRGAGTGAGGSGGGGGGSAIGTDGSDGGKGGKGFETFEDLKNAFINAYADKEENKKITSKDDLMTWLTTNGKDSDSAYGKHLEMKNVDGDGASSKKATGAGNVYFLNKGTTTLTAGTGGDGGRAGQGMPNREVTNKYRILGGGYGDYNSGRNTDDYNYYYMERIGGLRLLLGGGGGGGGKGNDGKKIGAGGSGGGGGGAGGLGAAEYHTDLAENNFYSSDKIKKICSNNENGGSWPNDMVTYCPHHQDNNMYGHYTGQLVLHLNKEGDDAKIYTPFACNGGGGGGGGGGYCEGKDGKDPTGGVGGGGAGGYINYISRRESFDGIIPMSDYLNRATHCVAYWTWRENHFKDYAPNWGLGGNPYADDSKNPSYRNAPSPYVVTDNLNDNIVRLRIRVGENQDWAGTDPLRYIKSSTPLTSTDYSDSLCDNKNLYYICNEKEVTYENIPEPLSGKVCKISNDSGKDGGNAVLRYRTNINGNIGRKECSCYCNKHGEDSPYPIYPTAWGGAAGTNGGEINGGTGGTAKNAATYNRTYYNQEWKQYDDGHGTHDTGPGSRHQAVVDGRDPVGIGCSAEGFNGNKGGNRAVSENNNSSVYYSEESGYNNLPDSNKSQTDIKLFDASLLTLEMYMANSNFTVHTNKDLNNIYWKIGNEEKRNTSQIPFNEEYFGKEITLFYAPRKQKDDTTEECYSKDEIYFGNGDEATERQSKCVFDKDSKLDSITIKYTFNFKMEECDWNQTNELLSKQEDSAIAPDQNTYPYYEAKYTGLATIPSLDVSYGDVKLIEGKHYDLNFYLAKTSYDTNNTSSWIKVDPDGKETDQDKIPPIASTTNENGKITTAESLLEEMPQYSKKTTPSTEIGDRIVVEFIPKLGFSENDQGAKRTLLTYSIVQANLSEDNISINLKPQTIEYDGNDHNTPEAREKFSIGVYVAKVFRNLNKDEFNIIWPTKKNSDEPEECKNVGDYGIRIVPKASTGYTGAAAAIFTIVPYNIGCENTAFKLKLDRTEFDFSREESQKPTVEVVKNDGISQEDYDRLNFSTDKNNPDYIVEYYNAEKNEDGSYKELTSGAGKKVVVVKGKNPYSYNKESTEGLNCNFTGMLTATYNINGTDLTSSEINTSVIPESFTYNGNEQKPDVIITKTKDGTATSLKEGTDYTVVWEENGDYTNAGTKKITIKGNGENGFTGEKEITYKIDPVDYNSESSNWEMKITPDSFYYNGTKLVPKVTVKYQGRTLEENKDYTLEYSDDSIDAGDKIITVKLQGNYKGKKELSYKIYNISYDITYGDGLNASLLELISKDYDVSKADLKVEKIVSSEEVSAGTDLSKYISIEGETLKVSPSIPASKYVISIKNNNDSIPPFYVNLSVAKATPELSIKDKTTVYTGNEITLDDISLKFKNNESFGDIKNIVSFDYYTNKECTSLVKNTPVNVGTYYVKAYVKAPNGNYENVTSNVATLTIQKAKQNLTGSTSYSGYPGSSIQVDTKTDANTNLTYKSADESIVQVDSQGKMLLMKDGTTTITTIAAENENYEAATFEATVVVDKTLNSITAGGKTVDNTIENNGSGNNIGSTSSGNKSNNSKSNGSSNGNSSGSSSSSNEGNSSQNNSSSQENDSSSSEENQEEESKSGLPLVADKFWSTILDTGDKSVYIISITLVSIAIALTILIVLKRKEKDE